MADLVPADVPLAGEITLIVLQMVTFGTLAACSTRRIQYIEKWKSLPLATWLILIIYMDSSLFVFITSIITRGLGINQSHAICDAGILLCLVCYMSTKVFIYYFLVERAYIVRGSRLPRHKTKLWLFNCLGMLAPYCAFVVMNFVYRIAYINEDGVCIIGMQKIAMLPLISFEVVVNVYLTLLFVIPLRQLYSYRNNTNTSLHQMAFRSFVGSCFTLTSSVTNLTILMVLKGEPGWICLMCCNADILFAVLVLHWVTQIDRSQGNSSNVSYPGAGNPNSQTPPNPASTSSYTATITANPQNGGISSSRTKFLRTFTPLSFWPSRRNELRLATPIPEQKIAPVEGEVVTECIGGAQCHGNKPVAENELVELRQIKVQTEQTREVEVEVDLGSLRDYEREQPMSEDGQCYGIERTQSAEKMV